MNVPLLLAPEWERPREVELRLSTRLFGQSIGKFSSLNLGVHVDDDPATVAQNRKLILAELPAQPCWLNQVHGNQVFEIGGTASCKIASSIPDADASFTRNAGQVLAILVADCVPVALVSDDGQQLAVVHAGWRGLANGILAKAVGRFGDCDIHAWLGPAIGPCHYEVDKFVRNNFSDDLGFSEGRDRQHWMMDLCTQAEGQLIALGAKSVTKSGICTACDNRFYSHRQNGPTGRFGVFLWKSL